MLTVGMADTADTVPSREEGQEGDWKEDRLLGVVAVGHQGQGRTTHTTHTDMHTHRHTRHTRGC